MEHDTGEAALLPGFTAMVIPEGMLASSAATKKGPRRALSFLVTGSFTLPLCPGVIPPVGDEHYGAG